MDGHKADSGKSRLDLVVPGFLWEVGHVLGHGAAKYGPNNWQHVEPHRYIAALYRHTVALQSGQAFDPETRLGHTAHIACSAMFLWHAENLPTGEHWRHRTCQCSVCQPASQHCTSTRMGE